MIGTRIGSYQIVSQLATGGMGAVYVAHHELMNRDAVVKVLLPAFSAKTDMVKRFFNEARAAASIHHPGIVEIYDLGFMADGLAYIVMEKLRGETLAARLAREGRIELGRAITYVQHIASALGAAHAAGIVHRDLKPDNLFVVPDPEVAGGERIKVVDFGIAKLQTNPGSLATAAGSIFGTPAYMAPEQCSDAATVDGRADLYAIGCIFYELLCGQPPFGKTGGIALLAAHLRDVPPPPTSHDPTIPAPIEAAILRLLEKKPEDRFASCEELSAALGATPRVATAPVPAAHSGEAFAPTLAPQDISRAPTEAASYLLQSRGSPGAAAMPLTTYQSASGQVSTSEPAAEPPPKKRAGLIALALVAVAGVGGVAAFAITRGGGESAGPAAVIDAGPEAASPEAASIDAASIDAAIASPPDAAAASAIDAAPPPRPRPKRIDLLAELEEAANRKDYAAVARLFAKMKPGSRGYTSAQALHDSAIAAYTRQVRARALSLQRGGRCDELAALEAEAKKVHPRPAKVATNQLRRCKKPGSKPSPGKKADVAELTRQARDAARTGNFGKALKLCEQAMTAGAGAQARVICGVAACNLKATAKAKRFMQKLQGARLGLVRQICLRNGIKL